MNKKEIAAFALFSTSILGLIGYTTYGHVDAEGTKQAAEEMGMTNVEIKGGAHLACRGFYKTAFVAVTPKGDKVEGLACRSPKVMGDRPSIQLK